MKFSSLGKLKNIPAPAAVVQPAPVAAPEEKIPAPEPQSQDTAIPAESATPPAQVSRPARTLKTPTPVAAPDVPFEELDARAREIYTSLMAQARELLSRTQQPYTEQYEAVRRGCEAAAEELKTNPVLLNYSAYSTSGDYLAGHTANTTLLALAMGLAARLRPGELSLLGFCAMAHDIGMTAYSHLYNNEARLNEDEFAEMALHAEEGIRKLDRIVDLDYRIKDRAKTVILQVHERLDGGGYPDRLSKEEIDPLAQFIGIADSYEALTHPRAWRAAISPPEAVKTLLEKEGRGFNSKAIKALIGALSIYPPTSLVALSTGEIARVIQVNPGSLTRPLVEIFLDGKFRQTAKKTLNLLKHPLTAIERGVPFKELEKNNPELAASLELAGWWVEW
ncbi:MAG: hypothetical protein A2234_08355 [Elusimicrobia bacterium RIFOXYA2_FULL_58_8]|nr:MAG: hypothetical protein A2285_07135 [Elusimicrobia bacterium RIFOXYA12_FULL_57_11]OGS17084.1 MAG: hypothetical protein A2234_08355 [Elusimicrobia bacterium RIFOXYA2_FULL_58_8]